MICSFNFLIFLAVCLNISTVINIKILTNSNQQIQSYKFTSHIAAFLSVKKGSGYSMPRAPVFVSVYVMVLIAKIILLGKFSIFDISPYWIFFYLPTISFPSIFTSWHKYHFLFTWNWNPFKKVFSASYI